MIRAILFDLDRTLLDRDSSVRHFVEDQHHRFSSSLAVIPEEEFCGLFEELDQQGYVSKENVYKQIVKMYDLNPLMSEQLHEDYNESFKHHCVAFSGLVELLDTLHAKRIQLGLITNGRGKFQMENIHALGIESYFEAILVSEIEGMKKPDSKIFHAALERMGVTAEESVFVGDHLEKDVLAAEKIGMTGVWKRAVGEKDERAMHVIDDLRDLLSLLKRI